MFYEHREQFKKMIVDMNAAAQQSALEAVKVFVDRCDGALNVVDEGTCAILSHGLGCSISAHG